MAHKTVYWKKENTLGFIILNHLPSNRMNRGFLEDLFDAIDLADKELEGVKAIIIQSSCRHFSSGADLDDIKQFITEGIVQEDTQLCFLENVYRSSRAFTRLKNFPVPVIAAVSGVCIGSGFELALAAHIRIAEKNATLGLPELTWNLMPGCGGTLRLSQLTSQASRYILTAETFTAKEAFQQGLINRIVKKQDLLPTAWDIAEKIAAHPISRIKEVMKQLSHE